MAEVDTKLVTGLRQAKSTPMSFAFVAKGASEGALIVAKKKVAAKEINEAKASCGGKLVFKGRCFGDGGKMVFEVAKEPPSSLAKQIRAVIHADAGLAMQVEVRVSADLKEDAEQESTEAAPATSAPPSSPTAPAADKDAARFAARLKALAPVMQKATEMGSPSLTAEAKFKISEANVAFRNKEFAEANGVLDEAEDLIKQALTAPAKPAAANEDAAARFSRRLKLLAPVMQKALATGHALAEQAKSKIGEANTAFRGKDYAQANALLDQAETLIKQALKAATTAAANPPAQQPGATAGKKSAGPSPEALAIRARLQALAPVMGKARKSQQNPGEIEKLEVEIQELRTAEDFAAALKIVDRLEPLVYKSLGAGNGQVGGQKIALRKAQIQWNQVRMRFQKELSALCNKLRSEVPEQADLADKIAATFEEIDDRLDKALLEASHGETPEELADHKLAARSILEEYQKELASKQDVLAILEQNPVSSITAQADMMNVLKGVETLLGA